MKLTFINHLSKLTCINHLSKLIQTLTTVSSARRPVAQVYTYKYGMTRGGIAESTTALGGARDPVAPSPPQSTGAKVREEGGSGARGGTITITNKKHFGHAFGQSFKVLTTNII
jgi:hypothetical protein